MGKCARKSRKNGCKVLYIAHGFHFYKGAPKINWMIYYPIERLFARSASESSVKTVIEMLSKNSHCEPTVLGRAVANVVGREWKDSSALRIGGGVKIWAQWIMRSRAANRILPPPGRMAKRSDKRQMYFSFE